MNWRHVLGVIAGVVSSIVLTLGLGLVMGIVMIVYYTSQGMTAHQAAQQMDFAHQSASLPLLLATQGLGAFAALLSGFLAAWIGRTAYVLTGLATGIAATVLSSPLLYFFPYPIWYDIAGVVATIGPTAMGGYLAQIFLGPRSAALSARPQ